MSTTLYFVFQAMVESVLPAHCNGLTEEVIIPGKDYNEAERNARAMLGLRYRGPTTVPVTRALVVKI